MRSLRSVFWSGAALLLVACGNHSDAVAPVTTVPVPPATELPDARAQYVLAHMTLAEKIQMVHGAAAVDWWNHTLPHKAQGWIPPIDRLGVPALYFADGSTGVRDSVGPATALPSALASAASWDLNEATKYGRVIGLESRAYGINVNLGGNVNLTGREPRCGRTFETKGEDPILAGRINAAHLKAIQDEHVIAGAKHYAFNDQEIGRMQANVLIDERSGRESDLLAFEISLKDSGAQSVMCSYNLVNGTYGCENDYLLNTVLKGEWAFPGFVLSDWDATHSTVAAARNGLDQEQPDAIYLAGKLSAAVQNGQVSPLRLDDMVQRILRAMFVTGLFDIPLTVRPIEAEADAALAQEFEEHGAVLLKNAGLLPLDPAALASVAVIGSHADVGVLSGGGSAQVSPVGGPALVEGMPSPPGWSPVVWVPSSPTKALKAALPAATVMFDDGTNAATAAALAARSSVAIVFVSQWESEGMDVPSLHFTDVIHAAPVDQDALVTAVAAANPRTIVVLEHGGPKVMPWLNAVGAVLDAWYPGQRGGEAIANILVGNVNPSGKLPITFPAKVEDLPRPSLPAPAGAATVFDVDYRIDGANSGYKWYASRGLTPLFPFGFGLSYTTFAMTEPQLVVQGSPDGVEFQVSLVVRNTGARAGAEVAQVYLQLPAETQEAKRLVGWSKVWLAPGQEQKVTIPVVSADSSHPLSYWDPATHAWRQAPGAYTVYVGNSSQDLATVGAFELP